MSLRERMQPWVLEAVAAEGGAITIIGCAKHVWFNHETDLKQAGDDFFNWQYEMRWAADSLRKQHKLDFKTVKGRSVWHLPGQATRI